MSYQQYFASTGWTSDQILGDWRWLVGLRLQL